MRQANPYYQDPTADIGQSLATAIFGNPAAAQQQAQARAEIEQRQAAARADDAHARLYGSQGGAVDRQNSASDGLPAMLARFSQAQQPEPSWYAPTQTQIAAGAPQTHAVEEKASSLANLMAGFAQMNGSSVDPRQIMGTLGAFSGDDTMARSGLIAQGHSPDKDFATTSGRADEIATRDAASSLAQALGVARTNHATDIPVANIKASADRDVALTNNRDDVPVARIAAGSRESVARIKVGTVALDGNNPGGINDGDYAKSLPGYVGGNGRYARFATLADGENAQKALLKSYIGRGYDTPSKIAERWAPRGDGNDSQGYAATIARTLGIGVDDRLSASDVDRFQAAQARVENSNYGSKKTAAAVKPRNVSSATVATIDNEISLARTGKKASATGGGPNMVPAAAAKVRRRAAALVQQGVDPVNAVDQAIRERRVEGHALKANSAAATKAPVKSGTVENWDYVNGKLQRVS